MVSLECDEGVQEAERIFQQRLKDRLERDHPHEFVAIEPGASRCSGPAALAHRHRTYRTAHVSDRPE